MSTDIDPEREPHSASEFDRQLEIDNSVIRALNDALRTNPVPSRGELFITRGVADRGPAFVADALAAVSTFSAFTPDNDPYFEHDFGAVEVQGERVFWKIDYYDRERRFASPDPRDPAETRRVLTVMLAEEY